MKKTLLLCLCVVASQACALSPESTPPESTTREAVGEAAAPIIGGDADPGDPAIVMIFVQNTTQEASCTATVVSPHVLLTAAHCLDPAIVDVTQPNTYYVFLGDDLNNTSEANNPANFVMVAKTAFDPLFNDTDTNSSHDIGVVITATPLTVPPLPLNRTVLGPEWIGQPVRTVGYGLSVASNPDSADTKRDGVTSIAGINDDQEWQNAPTPHMCEGDSGGPSLITRNGVESVAGVHSWIQHATSCTGNAYDMRVDVDAVPFVDPFIAQYDPGFVVPGDGSSANGGSGGGGAGGDSMASTATTTGGASHPEASKSSGCSITPLEGSNEGAAVIFFATLGLLRAKRRGRSLGRDQK